MFFGKELGVQSFIIQRWMNHFKYRYGISKRKISGKNVNPDVIKSSIEKAQEITRNYSLRDVDYMAEMGLFFAMIPEKVDFYLSKYVRHH